MMYVINNLSGEIQTAKISKIDAAEILRINKTHRFDFDWSKEKSFSVYKLTAMDSEQPIGMLSLDAREHDKAMHIRLLASSKENIGKSQKYSRIAGCLIAFACREAFKAGFDGFVFLKSKTKLEPHYIKKYGLQSTKLYLVTEGDNSLNLIREYYEN